MHYSAWHRSTRSSRCRCKLRSHLSDVFAGPAGFQCSLHRASTPESVLNCHSWHLAGREPVCSADKGRPASRGCGTQFEGGTGGLLQVYICSSSCCELMLCLCQLIALHTADNPNMTRSDLLGGTFLEVKPAFEEGGHQKDRWPGHGPLRMPHQ